MSTRRTPQTMYMHTLEGKPASFAWIRQRVGREIVQVGYIHFVGGRHTATLVPTLKRLRAEQAITQRDAGESRTPEWADPTRYGYVRVALPPEPSR